MVGLFGTSGAWSTVHFVLLVIRFLCIFLTGYPHPDEFFQSPEIAGMDIFKFNVFVPWEFADLSYPCRSIISPLIGSGVGYTILAGLSWIIPSFLNAFSLLLFPRLIMFLLSLIMDYTASKISIWRGEDPGVVLLILGSSWTMLVMHTRPFSNILESCFVTISFLLFFIPQENLTDPLRSWRFLLFGAVFSLGIFTRFTFVFFFFPIAVGVLYELLYFPCYDLPLSLWSLLPARNVTVVSRSTFFMKASILGVFGILSFSGMLIVLDSFYFGSWQLTVLNSFLYNLDSSNLAAHGIHPRYLHATVNMHILFGPLYTYGMISACIYAFSNFGCFIRNPKSYLYFSPKEETTLAQKKRKRAHSGITPNPFTNSWNSLRSRVDTKKPDAGVKTQEAAHKRNRSLKVWFICFSCVFSGCGLLSVAQHQEPRFLLPLLLPLSLLFAANFFTWKPCFVAWIIFNVAVLVFFGIMHQGGVVPSLAYVQNQSVISDQSMMGPFPIEPERNTDVVYYKTFMPPRFLLAQPCDQQYPVSIHDVGRSEQDLLGKVALLRDEHCNGEAAARISQTFLVSPSLVPLPDDLITEHVTHFWPHFSSEDLPESLHDLWSAKLLLQHIRFDCPLE